MKITDKMMMDWIQKKTVVLELYGGEWQLVPLSDLTLCYSGKSARKAVSAAIRAEKREKKS